MYIFFVGNAGIGKSRAINKGAEYYVHIPEHKRGPDSMTATSLIEALEDRRIGKKEGGEEALLDNLGTRNSMYITADELNAFIHKYDAEMIAYMCKFYDVRPFLQTRSTNQITRFVPMGQLNVAAGTTPVNLLKYMPENAWEQGFASRVIMIFSDMRYIVDDFAPIDRTLNDDLIHDLLSIATMSGQFQVTKEYQDAVNLWKASGEEPRPTHPKLMHYATRRAVHLYKLSMVAAVDRSEAMVITLDDWNQAKEWLEEAEQAMPDVFKAGAGNADAKAAEEIYHWLLVQGKNGRLVPEYRLWKFAAEHLPAMSVERVVGNMVKARQIQIVGTDKRNGYSMYKAVVPEQDPDI
jgi:hypothetical protein